MKLTVNFGDELKHANAKIVRDGDILKISKIDNPVNFLEIYQQ